MPTDDESSGLDWGYEEGSVEMTLGDRLRERYRDHIYEPGVVALDDWRFVVGGLIVLVYFVVGIVGPFLVSDPVGSQYANPTFFSPIKWVSVLTIGGLDIAYPTFRDLAMPLGTNTYGQSIFGLIIHATPKMLVMLLTGGVFATIMATLLGTVSGYKGGAWDSAITMFNDVAMTIPGLPLVIVIGLAARPYLETLRDLPEPLNLLSPAVIGMIIMINYWGGLSRAIRSQVLTLRDAEYAEASRTMGVGAPSIILKDVLPNLMPYILVNFVNAARFVIFSAVGLYYLGVLPANQANWGMMINNAQNQGALIGGLGQWYRVLPPVMAVLGIALGLILFSQGMDRLFNPRVRTKLASFDESDDDDSVEDVMNE
ncbi:ABC transporter permease [Halococcoides cellulosivorans]|uniref:ABC transporter permease n=1 Tax=Halococcoides cellulosivorans TaxID=1679096 RepID=A0A2R4X2U7_9EURY|nr:ABC transporter permease [Halococcoides cellulosivorans]AWB28118.1 ABC transporter permease [Halococcoides cellulosivorans]